MVVTWKNSSAWYPLEKGSPWQLSPPTSTSPRAVPLTLPAAPGMGMAPGHATVTLGLPLGATEGLMEAEAVGGRDALPVSVAVAV
jgi:hypothetical protein